MDIDNRKRYRATLRTVFGDEVAVCSTRNHPASSYGAQVWVDADGDAHGQIDLPMLGTEIASLREVTPEEADAWLEGKQ